MPERQIRTPRIAYCRAGLELKPNPVPTRKGSRSAPLGSRFQMLAGELAVADYLLQASPRHASATRPRRRLCEGIRSHYVNYGLILNVPRSSEACGSCALGSARTSSVLCLTILAIVNNSLLVSAASPSW